MMRKNIGFIIASIVFLVGGVFAFIAYFTKETQSSTWMILGIAMIIISIAFVVLTIKRK